MRAFIPIEITDEKIVSTSVAEPDANEPIWASTTTYSEFAQVSVISTNSHLVYESLEDGNVGNNPVTTNTDVLKTGAKWILKGKTNRHRMFDYNQGNPTVATSPLTVVLRPRKRIDALVFEGLKASEVDVTIRNGIDGPMVFTLDGYLFDRKVTSFYEYFFVPAVYVKTVATFAIPPIPDPVIYITLSDPSGVVELSRLAVGLSTYLGAIQWNPIIDFDNYSEISWDKFGKATLNPITSIPTTEQVVTVNNNDLNKVRQFRDMANAKAVLWSGLDDIESDLTESLILFGVYRNFQLDVTPKSCVELKLSLKGI